MSARDQIAYLSEQVERAREELAQAEADLAAAIEYQEHRERQALKEQIEAAPEEVVALPDEIHLFYLTVGASYSPYNEARGKHPIYPSRMSGKGFIVIEAPDRAWAEQMVWVHMGDKFSGIYSEDPRTHAAANEYWYPAGEIGRMDAFGVLTWNDEVWSALL